MLPPTKLLALATELKTKAHETVSTIWRGGTFLAHFETEHQVVHPQPSHDTEHGGSESFIVQHIKQKQYFLHQILIPLFEIFVNVKISLLSQYKFYSIF